MTKPPLFKLSTVLTACNNNPKYPRTFITPVVPTLLQLLVGLEAQANHVLSNAFEYVQLNRNTYLQYIHQPIEYLWILEEGVAHTIGDECRHEPSIDFHFPGEFIGRYTNFINQNNSTVSIKMLSKGKGWRSPCVELAGLIQRYSEAHQILDILLTSKIQWNNERDQIRHELSNLQYCTYIRKNFPQYFELIAKKYIASYIGLCPKSIGASNKH